MSSQASKLAGVRRIGAAKAPGVDAVKGIAIIEALVGLMIFSFGVLGLVGLQASMTKEQTASKYRAQASDLANEMIGLMWADNAANLTSYGSGQCSGYARCADWANKVASSLPSGNQTVTVATPGKNGSQQVSITITWTQAGEAAHSLNVISTVSS